MDEIDFSKTRIEAEHRTKYRATDVLARWHRRLEPSPSDATPDSSKDQFQVSGRRNSTRNMSKRTFADRQRSLRGRSDRSAPGTRRCEPIGPEPPLPARVLQFRNLRPRC
ncbi:hypothetical protein, partial [Rhodoplanes sp. SY1]|uniref:hypothetical protein n=1 Tax=Rhodoplanes sp. SY1 TaxID=3166646 RepID=UPI0038B4F36E